MCFSLLTLSSFINYILYQAFVWKMKQSCYRILQLLNKGVGNEERVIITRGSITGLPPSILLEFEFFLHASQKTTVFLPCIL